MYICLANLHVRPRGVHDIAVSYLSGINFEDFVKMHQKRVIYYTTIAMFLLNVLTLIFQLICSFRNLTAALYVSALIWSLVYPKHFKKLM